MANNAKAKNTPVIKPFQGLDLDGAQWQKDPRAFISCNNIRINRGQITNVNMGWTYQGVTLNGAVTMHAIFPSNGTNFRILGTPTDLYNWNNGNPVFITPIYATGTASTVGAAVTGIGTAWNTAIGTGFRKNVQAGDQISFGSAAQNSPSATWYTVSAVNSDTSLTLSTSPGNLGAQVYTVRQLAQGDAQDYHWNWEVFPAAGAPFNADTFFAVNGIDALVSWRPIDLFASYQGGMPFVSFTLRRFRNLMVYGGLVQKGNVLATSIANSDNGLPTSMNTGVAGQFIVSDGPFTINNLGILGNQLMIYMGTIDSGSVVAAQFVGGSTLFVFNEVIKGRGPIAGRLVAEFPDRHQFIGPDGEYRYNGLFVQVMNPKVWRTVLQQFDRSRANRAFSFVNMQFGDIVWAIPLTTDPGAALTTAYVEHYLEDPNNYLLKPITQRDFPFSCAGIYPNESYKTWDQLTNGFNTYTNSWSAFDTQSGSYALQYVGDINGLIHALYSGQNQNGAAMLSQVNFSQRITINERSRGLVKRVYPFIQTGSGTLQVTLNMFDQLGGTVAIVDIQNFALNYSGNRFTTHYRRGRLAQIAFSSNSTTTSWTMDGYDWDVEPGGVR